MLIFANLVKTNGDTANYTFSIDNKKVNGVFYVDFKTIDNSKITKDDKKVDTGLIMRLLVKIIRLKQTGGVIPKNCIYANGD